jgi:hypothetical protein
MTRETKNKMIIVAFILILLAGGLFWEFYFGDYQYLF